MNSLLVSQWVFGYNKTVEKTGFYKNSQNKDKKAGQIMKHAIASLYFSLSDNGPYYQQLMDQIKQAIRSGRLQVDDKLPSTRALAISLGVSRSTTSRAYEELIAEGFLMSEAKRGVFVAVQGAIDAQAVVATSSFDVNNIDRVQDHDDRPFLSFDAGVDISAFPHKEWAASMRRSWLNLDAQVLNGGYPSGLPALKMAIADYLYRIRGLACLPEQIVLTAGNRDALLQLQHLFVSVTKKAQWWVEEPTYSPIIATLSQQGNVGLLPTDNDGARLPNLNHSCPSSENVAVLTPSRQYPLGTTMSSSRRQEWIQSLQQSAPSWWVVEDDYDNEFLYQGRHNVPLMQTASLHDQARERLFFIGSFSKVLFRGLRLGFIVAPLKYARQLTKSQKSLGSSVSLPIQPAVADFMVQGGFDRHINRMRRHYRLKRDGLLALLDGYLTPWFVWQRPNGGMHILLQMKACWFTEQVNGVKRRFADDLASPSDTPWDELIATCLERQQIALYPLSRHFHGREKKQGFLFGFSGVKQDQMLTLIEEIHAFCEGVFRNEDHKI